MGYRIKVTGSMQISDVVQARAKARTLIEELVDIGLVDASVTIEDTRFDDREDEEE